MSDVQFSGLTTHMYPSIRALSPEAWPWSAWPVSIVPLTPAPLTPARGTLRALSACQLVTVKAALTLTFDAASNWGNWAWADMVYLSKMIEGDGGKSRVRR